MKKRKFRFVDVSDSVEIVDGCVVFDELKFKREEVKKLIKLFLNDLDRKLECKEFVKFDGCHICNDDCKCLFWIVEDINEICDDLCYLVSSLKRVK